MDGSTVNNSDSDSGDSWTIIENNSTYADDAPNVPDHPTESNTAENHDKDDEDTDGISIITDSEPESSTPCQISYEHYISEENSTIVHHIPQFITLNTELCDIKNNCQSEQDNDFLDESNGKHKTYVHRRNKRLSTVLNIIMLGSVITAAGIAIGHMWGAKTDCSMHTSTNVNKILSNLYKLQEENAYLWSKLKEITALNNYQMNQKATLKQNKCKKVFEEPLINNDSKKVTKCVDDTFVNYDRLMSSHMVEAAEKEESEEFLNETKDLTNERKSYGDSLKFFDKGKPSDLEENQSFKSGNKYLNENNKLYKRSYNTEIDSLFNDIDKLVKVNSKEYVQNNNKLKEEHSHEINLLHKDKNTNRDFDQLIRPDRHQSIKKKENNVTPRLESKDSDINKNPKGADDTERRFSRNMKDKDQKKDNNSETNKAFQMKSEMFDKNKASKAEYGNKKEYFGSLDNRNLIKSKIENDRTLHLEEKDFDKKSNSKNEYANEEILSKNIKDLNSIKNIQKGKNKTSKSKESNEFGIKNKFSRNIKDTDLKKEKSENKNAANIESKDFDTKTTSKHESGVEKSDIKSRKKYLIKSKNVNKEYDYENNSSENYIKDNKYIGQKHERNKKQERKKNDRQQLYKKNKKRNKYEQWEMKGGLLKDYDEISWTSFQDKDYLFNEPNLVDDKIHIHPLGDNIINSNIDTTADNLNHDPKVSKEDDISWLDKRARFRKEARQQLEHESSVKNGVNAAGWYFRRMRKREQRRGKGDNSTYRKLLKNYK